MVNHKRIERIWRQEGLQLPRRQVRKRRYGTGGNVQRRAEFPNHVWSYDFTEDRTERGQKIRVLAILDEFTRQALLVHVARSIPASRVWDSLQWLFASYGVPHHLRSDNGPEFIATLIKDGLTHAGCNSIFIEPGHPWENPFIERFIGTLKHECLNRYLFDSLAEAQVIVDHWCVEYNQYRPHSALGYLPPAVFAQQVQLAMPLTPVGT